jgi:hypothetical protein
MSRNRQLSRNGSCDRRPELLPKTQDPYREYALKNSGPVFDCLKTVSVSNLAEGADHSKSGVVSRWQVVLQCQL